MLAIIFVLFGCLIVFLYTPFYSNTMVRVLNALVPVEVNQVAAQSQQRAGLNDDESLEPGSKLWIARQAYLKMMQDAISGENDQDLTLIQARYKVLQKQILQQIEAEQKEGKQVKVPLLPTQSQQLAVSQVQPIVESAYDVLDINNRDHKKLMDRYTKFLKTHPIQLENTQKVDAQIYKDIEYLNNKNSYRKKQQSEPYAIVVLGGGLTLDKNRKDIIVNEYTRLRLETTLKLENKTQLPIVLSGVEAPYMQAWLRQRGLEANLLENKSMNTCENTRFSSLLLQKKGGAPTVLLITDRYHMPRTRRLFALNGIATIPVEAPMPTEMTAWQPSKLNYDHSRRANYEMLATIRDVLFGSSGCREVP
ncbi:DUF218 domain-containing protein [Acinetobacter calcoaceticus]|uniref:DUF218 domain-containing protein n=1 Tax=Acinetobacter calcoaceticus TaxID=471 RepID=A0A4R1XXF8_ACICA|nr:DUF218 domain-containing protein [Acinetobacter calcoaceticus]